MPGWYGVANVKWLSEVHLQEDRYLGNYQARWYRSVVGVGGTGEDNDPRNAVGGDRSHADAPEVGDRAGAEKTGGAYQVLGFVLNDGTPLKSVEVKIDERPVAEGDDAIRPTRSIPGSCSPIVGRARRRANTRWFRASPTRRRGAAHGRRFEPQENVSPR